MEFEAKISLKTSATRNKFFFPLSHSCFVHSFKKYIYVIVTAMRQANSEGFVVKTLDRKTLWEMQTPQVLTSKLH